MEFYRKGSIPFGLEIDWGYWQRIDSATLKDLCFLSLGIDPRSVDEEIKLRHEHEENLKRLNDTVMYISNEELEKERDSYHRAINSLLDSEEKCFKKQRDLYELVYPHYHDFFEHGLSHISIPAFIDTLKQLKIPYPEELDENLFIEKKDISEEKGENLTASQKSSLTQRFNQLEKLFNEVVAAKYGQNVTAYEIAKDTHTTEKTIKKYLKQ